MRVDITGYVEHLRRDLLSAAAAGGNDLADAIERVTPAFDAAVRMSILEALSDAAGEISAELRGQAVELRLKGRDPEFVVVGMPADAATASDAADPVGDDEPVEDETATARITLRLPEALKQRVDDAAAEARRSTNTWLVDAIRAAVSAPPAPRRSRGRQLSGWVR
jgi:hypothetical protein